MRSAIRPGTSVPQCLHFQEAYTSPCSLRRSCLYLSVAPQLHLCVAGDMRGGITPGL